MYILAYERFYQVLLSIGQISLICLSVHLCLCFNFLMVWVFVFIIVLLGFWLTGFCACRWWCIGCLTNCFLLLGLNYAVGLCLMGDRIPPGSYFQYPPPGVPASPIRSSSLPSDRGRLAQHLELCIFFSYSSWICGFFLFFEVISSTYLDLCFHAWYLVSGVRCRFYCSYCSVFSLLDLLIVCVVFQFTGAIFILYRGCSCWCLVIIFKSSYHF